MGHLPTPTPDMGEYSVEVRRESFFLHGQDPTDHILDNGPEPRHGLRVFETGKTFGVAEILIEDIPKIRAALDQVERIHTLGPDAAGGAPS